MPEKRKVLIAPLNWGLGHATRCIPLIERYEKEGWEVIIATNGESLTFLQAAFPHLEFHQLPGYNVTYSRDGSMVLAIVNQLPKLWNVILEEHKWTRRFVKSNPVDLIISDNRYGVRHKKVKSIALTHQVWVKSPYFEEMLNRFNHRMLNRFDECWIPDDIGEENLTGELSAPSLKIPKRFIGTLSTVKPNPNVIKDVSILCLLSGPEPQRSILQTELTPILSAVEGAIMVRGVVDSSETKRVDGLTVIDYVNREELQDLLQRSKVVICRSGYSSIMDIERIKIPAILIPTPGQTEQEYLAERMSTRPCYQIIQQSELDEMSVFKALDLADPCPV
jgi:UDP:flavonoid glycosyltransferase YjiC (YdhE family)